MKLKIRLLGLLALVISAVLVSAGADACTGTRLKAKDGSVVPGRTLEFAKNLDSHVIVIPRNFEITGVTPWGENGLKWKTRYAVVGANFCGESVVIDGLNEKGLSGGFFYFPGYAEYQKVAPSDKAKTISEWQLLTWILSSFETISEVKKALYEIKVAGVVFAKWGFVLPGHFIITDQEGNSIVIEYVKGQLNIYDNPFGVITNAPGFDWHTANIANYLNLSTSDVSSKKIAGETIAPFGQGSGLFGIPGDFTPPSRFIRVLFLTISSIETENARDTVSQLFHILNSFDIPKGAIREKTGEITQEDYTQWTTAQDLRNRNYYFKTENNSRIRVVHLLKCNLDAKEIAGLKMETPGEDVLDITSELK